MMYTKKPVKKIAARARAGATAERLAGVVSTEIRLGGSLVKVYEVGVGYARAEIPSLIRASTKTGCPFHIRNAKNPEAESAFLVSPQTLERLVMRPVRHRTLSEVLEALPFKHTGARPPRIAVPDNTVRALHVPTVK